MSLINVQKYCLSKITLIFMMLITAHVSFAQTDKLGAPVLTFCANNETIQHNKKFSNFVEGLTRKIFHEINHQIEFKLMPSERCLYNINMGYVDGDASRVAGLEKIYKYIRLIPESIVQYNFGLYTSNSVAAKLTWEDLENKRIGYLRGWKVYDVNVPKSAVITKAKDLNQLIDLYNKGRIDYYLHGNISGLEDLSLSTNQEMKFHLLTTRDLYIYLNIKHIKIIPQLTEALRKIKQSGAYDVILNYHFMKED